MVIETRVIVIKIMDGWMGWMDGLIYARVLFDQWKPEMS
jgi:hypothetical protein